MTDVQGRVAFITGGANGIGLGIARSLARAGARLALVDLDVDALARAKAELRHVTPVETFQLDVRDRDAYAAIAEKVEGSLGPVSLLFNNAGVAGGGAAINLTFDRWDWGIGINVHGVINGVQTFLPRMIDRGEGGHIVNTASGAGLAAGASVLYTTAKFAVVGMSEALHFELAPAGIGATVVCPGPVATDIMDRTAKLMPPGGEKLADDERKQLGERRAALAQMLQQGVSPDDVGEMILKAVRENRLYVHTDRFMEEAIKKRTEALLAAMPD